MLNIRNLFLACLLAMTAAFGCSGGGNGGAGGGPETLYENTVRSGTVTSSERWRGVITVTGDVAIYSPGKVAIEPGTQVVFTAGSDDQAQGGSEPITDPFFPGDPPSLPSQMTDISIFGGSLHAVGTEADPIVFTSSADNPVRGDWGSIAYRAVGGELRLEFAVVEYGYSGVQINVAATDADVTIRNNTFRHIVGCGVCGGIDPAHPVELTITGNVFSDCGHEGIDIHSNATFLVEGNTFIDNFFSYGDDGLGGNGIVTDNSPSVIRNNLFSGNRTAISILSNDVAPIIYNNEYSGNETNFECPFIGPCGEGRDRRAGGLF